MKPLRSGAVGRETTPRNDRPADPAPSSEAPGWDSAPAAARTSEACRSSQVRTAPEPQSSWVAAGSPYVCRCGPWVDDREKSEMSSSVFATSTLQAPAGPCAALMQHAQTSACGPHRPVPGCPRPRLPGPAATPPRSPAVRTPVEGAELPNAQTHCNRMGYSAPSDGRSPIRPSEVAGGLSRAGAGRGTCLT